MDGNDERMIKKVVVDHGGSWTRIEALDPRGRILKRLKFISGPLPRLHQRLAGIFQHWRLTDLSQLLIGAKSIWSPSEKKWLHQRAGGLAKEVTVLSDIELAHAKAFGRSPGILILAGTGSIALGKNSRGKWARAGGLGPRAGDEGSGFWIGKMYCKRVLRRTGRRTPQSFARFAPNAIGAAQRGQTASIEIIDEAQRHLLKLVQSVEKQLGGKQKIKLAGGLFENAYFRKGFLRLLRAADSAL